MLGVKDDPPPHPKVIQLQKMIRQAATIFLQERMFGLPKLPNGDELQKLQETRRQILHKQIQQEKQVALLAQQQAATHRSSRNTRNEASNTSPNKVHTQKRQLSWQTIFLVIKKCFLFYTCRWTSARIEWRTNRKL